MTPPVSVVVPAHGDGAALLPLLDALSGQVAGGSLRVVVSDDASPQPLADAVHGRAWPGLDVHVIRSDTNAGPGAARNRGLSEVPTPWIAFLDADMIPAPDWLERLEALVSGDDAPDVIEGRTRVPSDRPATPFTHATEIVPPGQRGAGNIVFRTEVLRSAGGFDERFFDTGRRMHFREDAELLFRLEAAGARFAYEALLVADHPPLPESFWTPVRMARRYYFDPLLAREHPRAFRSMNAARRVGPVSLRRARHDAAVVLVGSAGAVAAGVALRDRGVVRAGVTGFAVGWLANAVAVAWRRTVRPRDVVPLAGVSLLVPWVYLWNYWRGVRRFRCRPRL